MNRVLLLSALAVLVLSGCAGARVAVTANRARYPISLSPMVRDKKGRLHNRHTLEKVGTFETTRTSVGFFYSLLSLPWTADISEAVNAQVAAAGGEALIDFDITVDTGCDLLNFFPLLNALPIWPGCVPVTAKGDIVRRRTSSTPVPVSLSARVP